MKRALRVISFTVIATLLFGLLYACGDKKAATTGKVSATNAKTSLKTSTAVKTTVKGTGTQQASTQAGDVNGEIDEPDDDANNDDGDDDSQGEDTDNEGFNFYDYDFGGRTIVLFTVVGSFSESKEYDFNYGTVAYYDENGKFMRDASTNVSFNATYDHWREVERKMNCKIIVKKYGSWTTFPIRVEQEVLSGVSDYDLVFPGAVLAKWAKMGICLPLDDYIDFNSMEKLNDPVTKANSSWGGKYYTVSESGVSLNYNGLTYNPGIGVREGLPDLNELFLKGQWTWEALLNITRTATKDINGDGIVDQWGAQMWNTSELAGKLLMSNGVPLVEVVDGRVVHNINTPEFSRAITFASDLINIYKVIGGNYTKGQSYIFLPSQVGYHNAAFYKTSGIDSKFTIMPTGPDNPSGKTVISFNKFGWYIPATVKDPRSIAYLLANLMLTYNDPDKFRPAYEELCKNYVDASAASGWPVIKDHPDMIDLKISVVDNAASYVNLDRQDVSSIGFSDITTILNTSVFGKIASFTPVADIIQSTIPLVDAILDEYNNN